MQQLDRVLDYFLTVYCGSWLLSSQEGEKSRANIGLLSAASPAPHLQTPGIERERKNQEIQYLVAFMQIWHFPPAGSEEPGSLLTTDTCLRDCWGSSGSSSGSLRCIASWLFVINEQASFKVELRRNRIYHSCATCQTHQRAGLSPGCTFGIELYCMAAVFFFKYYFYYTLFLKREIESKIQFQYTQQHFSSFFFSPGLNFPLCIQVACWFFCLCFIDADKSVKSIKNNPADWIFVFHLHSEQTLSQQMQPHMSHQQRECRQ